MGTRPTHFPGGLSNTAPGDNLYQFPYLDPMQYNVWFSDFNKYVKADWTVTKTTTSSTDAIVTGDGGILQFQCATLDDNLIAAQWDGNSGAAVVENFLFDSTKYMFMKTRLKISDADAADIAIGLQITDTSPGAVSDGIFFELTDGDATVTLEVEKNGTASTQAAGDLTDDTYHTFGFAYIPGTGFQVFFDNALAGTITSTTNAPDDEELAISIAMQSGAVAGTTMSVDYLLIAKER
tara:strand:+ start:109 stop:819 length:711 start_codon:yes stop_codon:yes gene_type:complete